jgi:hypothetical protein
MQIKKPASLPDTVAHDRGSRLTRKRYSCRLPLDLASRLEALCEMHPEKTRAQLMGDVLGVGLAEVERAWSGSASGLAGFQPDTRQPIYLLTGPFAEFHGLIHKHHLAMEHELARHESEASYPVDGYTLGDVE